MESRRLSLLIIRPQMLTFHAPYRRIQRRLLTLLNPTSSKFIFKVRSNANRHYNVSPYCGSIDAYATSEIQVELGFFDFQSNQLYRHRFVIQWAKSPKEDLPLGKEILSLFKNIPQSELDSVRIPIHLNEFGTPVSQSEWDLLGLVMDERLELRALCPNCEDPDRPKRAKRRKICRKICKILLIMGTIVGVYFLRHKIYEFIKIETDDIEL
ncbi:vesicle-associated membrane protein-associated protein A isoform X2 [Drosophila willistoni]|uniref:vesicle-associated membrane protein-associated protein A isoform X2 n=1 Tax=Drosophila willistoni TaxID=7260 RepID=UPI000C26D9CB|nr:vesicle-associated membrane protein-associated protein A isoform X2 [Drosophila willistoni]